jgi:uncharacterized protein (TIGR03034 family)
MTLARFPQTIFSTQRPFDDYGTDDMRCGDITESRLKDEFALSTISNVVDPYTLTRLTAFNNPQSRFAGVYGDKRAGKVSVEECARLLFDELQVTSLPFSVYGPYRNLIYQMFSHMQTANGAPFRDLQLDRGYREQILNDDSRNSTRLEIKAVIEEYVDYVNKAFPQAARPSFTMAIGKKVLPKFDSLLADKINGLGISVHDVYATQIELLNLDVISTGWKAKIKYVGQDHFGLDVNDISTNKFRQFQFFRIWFVLQRFNRFGFRPFLTNMEAIIDIEGGRK